MRLASHLKRVDPHSPAADLVSLFASGTHAWGRKDFTGIGICAYQIGVINILRDAGVHPDYIVGHSLGETAAGYAAGLQTERETILIQWVRSRMIRKVRTSHHLLRTRRPIDGLEQLFEEGGVPSRGGYFHYYVYDADEFRNSGRFRPGSGDLLFDLRGQMSVVGLSAGVIEAAIQEMGIGSTPSFIINGTLRSGMPSFEEFSELIDKALKETTDSSSRAEKMEKTPTP